MNVTLQKSTRKNKKFMMIFQNKKTVHFGNRGSEDFTTSGDERKKKVF